MLNNLGRTGHLQKMQELFDEMKAEGFKVTRVTLTNVISWFYKGKDMASVACHWHKLRRAGIKPSAAIYTAYIDFLLSKNRHGEITHIFEEMLRVDCLPNSRTYSMFIEYLVNAGNPDAGAKIVKLMHCMKVTPSKVAYRILVNGFGRLGKIEQLLDTLSEMREHFYRPTKQLIPAIRALELSGKVEEAREISSEIMSYGNTACVNAISRNGVDIEDEGNDDDDDDGNDGVEADSVRTVWRSAHCSHILFDIGSFVNALYSWNSNVERVLEQENLHWERSLVLGLLRRMKNLDSMWPFFHWLNIKLGFKHDCYGCSFLVRIILKSTLSVDKMDFLIRELFKGVIHDRMGEPAVPLFNLVIRHYVGMGEVDKASEMLKFLKDTGLEPNKFTYKFLIEGFARCCRRREVVLMLKEMEESGFSLESSTSAEVINFLGQIGKIQKAYALFCKIFQSGRKPSCDEYKAIMTIYFMKGENDMALKLYEDMRKYGIKPTQDMYDLVTGILRKAYRFSDMQDLAQERQLYRFFDGRKKVLQENLLEVLFIFTTGLKHKSREFKPGLR
ncbi:hypothetical protein KP509_26G072600 [Ceratopteris richardii]|nr:hypothetical protein KP509_26G072600 [Ceratopteris richardii]